MSKKNNFVHVYDKDSNIIATLPFPKIFSESNKGDDLNNAGIYKHYKGVFISTILNHTPYGMNSHEVYDLSIIRLPKIRSYSFFKEIALNKHLYISDSANYYLVLKDRPVNGIFDHCADCFLRREDFCYYTEVIKLKQQYSIHGVLENIMSWEEIGHEICHFFPLLETVIHAEK